MTSPLLPPTPEELHGWGWEIGAEAGRTLANESDAFIAITVRNTDAPDALRTYARAYLRAFIRSYRAELIQLLALREDSAANAQPRGGTNPSNDK